MVKTYSWKPPSHMWMDLQRSTKWPAKSSRITITFIQGPTKVQTIRFCVSFVFHVISNEASQILSLLFTYWLSIPLRFSRKHLLVLSGRKMELHTILWVLGEIMKCISHSGWALVFARTNTKYFSNCEVKETRSFLSIMQQFFFFFLCVCSVAEIIVFPFDFVITKQGRKSVSVL